MSAYDNCSSAKGWPVIHIVGIGDNGAGSLSPTELALVQSANLLCGGRRHLAFFPDHPAERFVIKSNLDELTALLSTAGNQLRAVVLASGDPCFFGIAPILAARLGHERVMVHPHSGSVALAFARLGMSWQDATVLSAHGRPLQPIIGPALHATKFAVLTDPSNTPAAVARALCEAGMEDATAWVCEHLGGPRERVVKTSLHRITDEAFAPLNVLVVQRDPQQARLHADAESGAAFGRGEEEYRSLRGQITKGEVRAVALSKLQPWSASTAWDVGAGSGSLTIELAGQMPSGTVYAIERHDEQVAVLRHNLELHIRPNVKVVHGSAPRALADLPRADAIFVGGSSGELPAILESAALALLPGGRLVANFAQLESLAVWQNLASRCAWPCELVQLSVSRAAPIGDGTRLVPLGPVFITTLTRPKESHP
ncbi:MAG: precorrin-6y C5,15-methyltransferase (decarboxylating) subunit CbiE [Dehalococcoidia bacterium]